MTASRSAGRPRDQRLDQQLIQAAQELLGEVGYDKLSMEAVAERTGASKATVYRRWKTKSDLVIDAVRDLQWEADAPDTGSLRSDLLALAATFLVHNPLRDGALAGLATAMACDVDIRASMLEIVHRPRYEAFAAIMAKAHARGEIPRPDGWDLVRDIFPAMLFYRVGSLGLQADEVYALRLIDELTIPLLTGKPFEG